MELHVQPATDTAGHYTWNLVYGKPSEDNRPYLLKPVATTGKGTEEVPYVDSYGVRSYQRAVLKRDVF